MINLYVVRHGQTKWNVERRFQGWLDSPLTENGVKCAADLRDQLSHIQFDACYASTSPRAYKTLELILSKNTSDYRTDDRLKEIRLGAWQGMTHTQIEDKYPVELELFYDDPESFNLEEAETFTEVYSRVKSFIDDVVADHEAVKREQPDKEASNVLIVTHGVTLKLAQLIFDNAPLGELVNYNVAHNAQVHHYQYKKGTFDRIK